MKDCHLPTKIDSILHWSDSLQTGNVWKEVLTFLRLKQ